MNITYEKFYKVATHHDYDRAAERLLEFQEKHPGRTYKILVNHRVPDRFWIAEVVEIHADIPALPPRPSEKRPDSTDSYHHWNDLWAKWRKILRMELEFNSVKSRLKEKMPR